MRGGADDLGIGNSPSGHPDWTFWYNANSYTTRTLTVYAGDTISPTVTAFTAASPSSSLNIPITAFTASDNSTSVAGYMITTSSTPPSASATGWTVPAPTTYTVASNGTYTLYPWAKDAAGNVSAVFGSPRTVVVTAPCNATNNGNWNNVATWDCGAVPTAGVNVTITGKTVTLDVDTADLGSLTLGSGGILQNNGTARTLSLAGNWSNSGTFTPGTYISVTFDGTGAQTIGGSAVTTFYNLTINNTGSGVALGQNATVNGTLTLTSDLTTSSNVLTLGSNAIVAGAKDVVGTTRRSSPVTGSALQFNNLYTTINFATAPSQMDVILTKSAPGGLTSAVSRYYTLTPTGAVNATIQLAYQDSELGSTTEANEKLWRYDVGMSRWVLQGGTVNTTNNYVSLAGVTQFSNWAITDNGAGSPTAVKLASFDANALSFDWWRWLTSILGR